MLGELIGAAASLAGNWLSGNSAEKNAAKQAKLQKQFAQNGIQWKVEDAKKAGISPLYALGANTVSYSPQSVGDTSLGSGIAQAGQDVGRAINATRSNDDKILALNRTMLESQVTGVNLDNEIKRAELASKIATQNNTGITPGMPTDLAGTFIAGQGNSWNPSDRTSGLKLQKQLSPSDPTSGPQNEAGLSPEVSWFKTSTGWVPQIPQQLGESMEDDWVGRMQWNLRNRLYPVIPDNWAGKNPYKNRPFPAPRGKSWSFNAISGEWQLVDEY